MAGGVGWGALFSQDTQSDPWRAPESRAGTVRGAEAGQGPEFRNNWAVLRGLVIQEPDPGQARKAAESEVMAGLGERKSGRGHPCGLEAGLPLCPSSLLLLYPSECLVGSSKPLNQSQHSQSLDFLLCDKNKAFVKVPENQPFCNLESNAFLIDKICGMWR